MQLAIDTHLHIYPCYDLRALLTSLRQNLAASCPDAVCMAMLAERHDCRFFRTLAAGTAALPEPATATVIGDQVVKIRESGHPDLFLFAGRQVITAERIEILALTTDDDIADGLPAADVVTMIGERGGIPVISWAPGKWFFSRGRVVEQLLAQFAPGALLLGDTTLRPRIWPMPRLMRQGLERGFGLVAGSDPLPFAGEERLAGGYGIALSADLDLDDPLDSLRSLLSRSGLRPTLVGRRGKTVATLRRLVRNSRAGKKQGEKGQR